MKQLPKPTHRVHHRFGNMVTFEKPRQFIEGILLGGQRELFFNKVDCVCYPFSEEAKKRIGSPLVRGFEGIDIVGSLILIYDERNAR